MPCAKGELTASSKVCQGCDQRESARVGKGDSAHDTRSCAAQEAEREGSTHRARVAKRISLICGER